MIWMQRVANRPNASPQATVVSAFATATLRGSDPPLGTLFLCKKAMRRGYPVAGRLRRKAGRIEDSVCHAVTSRWPPLSVATTWS
ncbi:hypothetical protein GCM10022286_08920 [Gryllotalpicola daejeonensis]|uniref:Uncharacterized protein n=1 Tax=Gryllotalpicola daejeonensis TaxID=993087 RepID=A0ABP7ZHP5_9MICO